MRLALVPLIGLLAVLGDSCAEDDSCNPIGCDGRFEWGAEPAQGVLEPGNYVLHITLEDSVYRASCPITAPDDDFPSYCGSEELISGPGYESLDGPHLYITEDEEPAGFAFWATNNSFGPASASVSITRDGEVVGEWTYDDIVYEKWPDGGHCGTCYHGRYVQETW